ncbi:MAG: hypothetical protein HY736_10930 [Verrucomicrobia bacterium]|nr:hypothetical protein [Verrucomicrobiota bacterium]
MSPFDLFVGNEASRKLIELPADDQPHALAAFQTVAEHPFTTGLPRWVGPDGRTRYLRAVRGWLITFRIDHAERSVRILDLDRS